jgi:hypothetical protein
MFSFLFFQIEEFKKKVLQIRNDSRSFPYAEATPSIWLQSSVNRQTGAPVTM